MAQQGNGELNEAELAGRAGVPVAFVRRAAELDILRPGAGDRPYRESDLSRLRLALACDLAGLSLEGIGKAVAEGRVAFDFLEGAQYRFAGHTEQTYRQLCDERGLDLDVLRRLQEAQGIPPPGPEDLVRQDDLPMIGSLQIALLFGVPPEPMVRMMRVYGETMRRIADGENQFYRTYIEEPMLAGGMSVADMMAASSQFGNEYMTVMDSSLLAMYHRQQERVWLNNMVERIEAALEEMGLAERPARPPAMCFLDLVGYTRLTEERGDVAAAELAASLAGVVQGVSQRHGGRPVKWLGDGVMFYFPDPGEAVRSSLEMVAQTGSAGLPPAHVGLHAGPVVQQDGDFFGRTVNLASRVAGRAGGDEVLVTDDVLEVAAPIEGVRFRDAGPADLKNVAHPVRLWRAEAWKT
jgi:adenylate cyclase